MSLVVYSARTGRIRRVITDAVKSDFNLLAQMPVAPGEAAELNMPDTFDSLADLQRLLNQRTGLVPSDDRYVCYDPDGVVIQEFIGDPDAGDVAPRRHVIRQDNDARIEWRRNQADTTWERDLKTIEAEIDHQNDIIAEVNTREWNDRQLARGLTQRQVTDLKNSIIAAAEAEISTLNLERRARVGSRPT